MKVILCDKCRKVLEKGDKVIVASAVRYEIVGEVEIGIGGISRPVLTGDSFCSVVCLKESIQ